MEETGIDWNVVISFTDGTLITIYDKYLILCLPNVINIELLSEIWLYNCTHCTEVSITGFCYPHIMFMLCQLKLETFHRSSNLDARVAFSWFTSKILADHQTHEYHTHRWKDYSMKWIYQKHSSDWFWSLRSPIFLKRLRDKFRKWEASLSEIIGNMGIITY